MINIIIPMAGLGQRFINAGFDIPKPLIQAGKRTLIGHAISSFDIQNANWYFIIRQYDYSEWNTLVENEIKTLIPSATVCWLNKPTEGTACTVLTVKNLIDLTLPTITADCDRLDFWSTNDWIQYASDNNLDACPVTFTAHGPQYSYVKVNENGNIVEAAEKKEISQLATCGIHYWKTGQLMVSALEGMIENNDRTNGEFYITPSYNYICKTHTCSPYHIENKEHINLGTPQLVLNYLNGIISETIPNK